jgi:hypothetical protein
MSTLPAGYTAVYLPTVAGPAMVWQCHDCAAAIPPGNENAATHDRFHDRVASKPHGRRR